MNMNMMEAIKQGIFSTVGLASLTQEKISEIVAELGKHIPLTDQQARDFAEEMKRRSEQAKSEFGQQWDHQVDSALIQMGLVKNEIRKATESASDAVQRTVEDRVRGALDSIGAASAEEVDALKKRVEILEAKIEKLS